MRSFLALLFVCLTLCAAGCIEAAPSSESRSPVTGYTPVAPPTSPPSTPLPTPQGETTSLPVTTPTVLASCGDNPRPDATPSASPVATADTDQQDEATPVTRLIAPTAVPTPQPFTPATFRDDFALEAQLRDILGDDVDGFAVVTKDLETGKGARINPDQVFYSASIFKIFVMYELFYQRSLGLVNFSDQLIMTPYYDSFGLGPRETQLCEQLTVAQAMAAMMSVSDNAAAVLLQDLVGAPNINAALAGLGLTDSHMDPDNIPITAQDIALLLEDIGSGQAVDRDASETMVALMTLEQFDNGLVAGVPKGTIVAHKTGNWDNARHDVGIVFAPNTTYLVVILSDNRSTTLTQQLSEAIYNYYASATP